MTDEQFYRLCESFPGDHRRSWRVFTFFFKTKEEHRELKAMLMLLGIPIRTEGQAGVMSFPYYLTVDRNDHFQF